MKKIVPYLLIAVVFTGIILLIYSGDNRQPGMKELDRRLSFRKNDKIPYGTFIAYENLQHLFPQANISTDKSRPGDWQTLTSYEKHQALLVVSPFFEAEQSDMDNLLEFVKQGNDVFVSAMKISYYVEKMLKCDAYYPVDMYGAWQMNDADSLAVSLDIQAERKPLTYLYPGQRYDFWFHSYDSLTTTVLGYNDAGQPNFIHLKAGKGNFYLQLAPMTFTNYFLLHKKNIDYYERTLSVIPADVKKVVWDEYYILKGESRENNENKKNPDWLDVFFSNTSLRWAMIVAMLTLLVYILMEMRRKQRPIPVIHPPKNDSLDFVKTIGRLYHDKGDHRNLCLKMSAYFLEHVRTRYKLATSNPDDEFVKNLSYKTGIAENELKGIIAFINYLPEMEKVSPEQLIAFHKQLESFYKTA